MSRRAANDGMHASPAAAFGTAVPGASPQEIATPRKYKNVKPCTSLCQVANRAIMWILGQRKQPFLSSYVGDCADRHKMPHGKRASPGAAIVLKVS